MVIPEKNIIWTMWWQGEDNAPPIVRACIKSIRRYVNGAKVIVISKNNYDKYVKLPRYILDKFENNCFSITQLSDMLRVALLYEYGGLWLDSTILITEAIPKNIFEMDFYSLVGTANNNKNIAKDHWCCFFMAGKAHNILFKKVRDLCYDYWLRHDEAVCYGFVDFFMGILYDADIDVRKMIETVPRYNNDVFALSRIINYEAIEAKSIKSIFNKLSCKELYNTKTVDGHNTVYSSILHEYMESDEPKTKNIRLIRLNRKTRSAFNLIKRMCSVKRVKNFGFKICFLEFANLCMRTSTCKIAQIISDMYNREVVRFLKKDCNCG